MDKCYSILFFAIAIYADFAVSAQTDVVKVVKLDEFVVSAAHADFDVNDFITKVVEDTTFYQAFLNLKYFPHDIDGEVLVYEKDVSEKATMFRSAKQHLDARERMWVDINFETSNGKIRKSNGEWRYLTAEMYDEVFFPQEAEPVSNRIQLKEQELSGGSKIEKHKSQLKRMMFNPGKEIGNVPFIGDKMDIFDDHMVPYYDYTIYNATYQGKDCIAFSCLAKEDLADYTVIKDLTSFFDPDTYQVLAREYQLAYSTLFFTFDIHMKVENDWQNGWLLPTYIHYDGFWTVPFRKPEIIQFNLYCYNYRTDVGAYRPAGPLRE